MRKTIAQRKAQEVMREQPVKGKSRRASKKAAKKAGRFLPLRGIAASTPFAAIAYFCKYVLPGYSFTALVCMGIIGVILFYTFMPTVGRWMPRFAKITTVIFTVALVIGLALFAVTEGFIIRASFGDPGQKTDYLVVLGAKVRPDGPSVSLWDRIYKARDYLLENPDVIAIVSGGQGTDEVMTEAQSMHDELVKLGIPEDRIWMEDKASSTDENMRFSLDLIQSKTKVRPTRLAILSSEYHLFRASLMADKLGIDFVGVPAKTSRLSQLINHGMREVAGVWHFFIFGR